MKKLLMLLLILTCFVGTAKTFEPLKVYDSKENVFHFDQDTRKKTVKVKSYKRKNGTVVKAHNRRPPRRH